MKKALFVDHAFHQKTRSSDFFIEIVGRGFEVEVYYLTPEQSADPGVLTAAVAADVIVLWQMDFLAPVFRAMGKPTIVIPMYDGSAGLPDLHWAFASGARFLNFSLRLNERIRLLGGQTMLLRYFPPPAKEKELPRFDQLNAFFWQRRPDHGVHFDYVDALLGGELDSFHLHNAPDVPGYFPRRTADTPYKFTESTWFKNKSDYEACLASSNVFIAPRASEGIGLALLEAMARGMLVLAHDAPTNNEYISNGINGILFNKDAQHEPIRVRGDAERMGRLAWRTVVEGHQAWLDSHSGILSWIDGAEAAPPIQIDLESFFKDAWHSYYGSLSEYETFLRRHLGVLDRLSALPFGEFLDQVGGAADGPDATPRVRDCLLDAAGQLDLTVEGDRYTGTGWSPAEAEWRWAVGKRAELSFSGLKASSGRMRGLFVASALPELGRWVRCTVTLNDTVIFSGRVTPGWHEYEFGFDAELLRAQNRMLLEFDRAMSIPTDPRELSVRFKSFRFSEDLGIVKSGSASRSLSPVRGWQWLRNRVSGIAG